MLRRNLPNLSLQISPPAASPAAAASDAPATYSEGSDEVGFFANPSFGAEPPPPGLSLGLATPARGDNDDATGRRGHLQPPQGCAFKRAASSSSLPAGSKSKRSARAPRMRWTTALHARFVHAVGLLGGHESKQLYAVLPTCATLIARHMIRYACFASYPHSLLNKYFIICAEFTNGLFCLRARSVLLAAARPFADCRQERRRSRCWS
jgi:hypothetical protein